MEMIRNIGIRISHALSEIGLEIAASSKPFSFWEAVGFKIDGISNYFFAFFYEGSAQEIEDALNFTEDEWPSKYMSERQIKARINAPEDSVYIQSFEPFELPGLEEL